MGLEELLKNQQQLTAATQAIRQTFDETMASYEALEHKLLQALESNQQQRATALKNVGAILDGIINKK